jgi:zinc-binding alcohol dehydrogenase family protein
MKAVGYRKSLPVSDPDCLVDFELPAPSPGPRDLVVDVRAVSVNPVDFKVRLRAAPDPGATNILGFDAAGVVEAVGNAAVLFKPGDPVFYAGSIARPGSNAERQLVDERIVGHKPKVLSFAEAAALPLTAITAWELLFDRLGIVPGKRPSGHLLIIGGAGGVGSILIQLARRLTGLVVIATASRPETAQWCRDLGAHHTIDHSKPLPQELRRIGIAQVDFLASLTASERHFPEFFDLMKPQGKLALIDDPKSLDITPLKRKSISVHWELMFTRPLFETEDMIAQHHLLDDVAALVDAGVIRTTLAEHFGPITAANLRKAHALLETGTAKGKIVLEGF